MEERLLDAGPTRAVLGALIAFHALSGQDLREVLTTDVHDTKRYVDAVSMPDDQRRRIHSGNARRVYLRLDARLARRGL